MSNMDGLRISVPGSLRIEQQSKRAKPMENKNLKRINTNNQESMYFSTVV